MLWPSDELKVHDRKECAKNPGGHCTLHKPSDHHMNKWQINIRMDRYDLCAERMCPHGIGHPDPDWIEHRKKYEYEEDWGYLGVHGCDGCCWGADS